MDLIVKQLVDQLGLDEAIARQAVTIVLGMLKDKFPEPISGQIDALLTGEGVNAGDNSNGVMSALGGLFGKK